MNFADLIILAILGKISLNIIFYKIKKNKSKCAGDCKFCKYRNDYV